MAQRPGRPRLRDRSYLIACALAGVVGVVAVLAVAFLAPFGGGQGGEARKAVAPSPVTVPTPIPPAAAPADLATLRPSTTYTLIDGAPQDSGSPEPTNGAVVHPRWEIAVYAAPGAAPIAKIGPQQLGDTWLPVIAQQTGWVQVLLPSRPNSSTGWLTDDALDRAVTPYLIRVHLRSLTMELLRGERRLGTWPAGIGKKSAPTPVGRTFLLGSFADPKQAYSPVILPLGAHSPTLDSFGGGPGTVAIHTWPTTDVFGTRSSDGCIRVPADALNMLTEVPLGTLVLIDEN
ncbi:MAG: L,D-transpeptidase [Pseudonocardiaceae bacterium]